MSVESLMVHEVTVLNPSGETQSSSGEVTTTYSSAETTMYIEPRSGTEVVADRNTPIGDWWGFCHVDDPVTSTSRILYGAHTFDVVAPPRPKPNPRLDTISHVELDLQEVDTVESVDAIATPDVVGGEGGV